MIGVLLGQKKDPDMGWGEFVEKRSLSFGLCWVLFSLMPMIYVLRTDTELERSVFFGLLALSVPGLLLGMVAGLDKDR